MNGSLSPLELELRRLPGVALVGFTTGDDTTVVRLFTVGDVEMPALRAEADRLCAAHLDVPVVVDIEGPPRPARVKLLHVVVTDAEDDSEVEVHLAYQGVRTVGRAQSAGPVGGAQATLDALARLGAPVPFRIEAAATFDHAGGEGVMVVLGSAQCGDRFGAAMAHGLEQAAARAALHALNRYLASQPLAATA